jgi:hypothetical protein
MKNFVRVLVIAWTLASVGLGVLAFAVVQGTGGGVEQAAYEALETVPEAVMQAMGFAGAPAWVVIAYWIGLAAALVVAFKRK